LSAVLFKAHMSWEAKAFICWFGPRGLNSLLLALLVVVAGIEGSELLLATVGVVVIGSVFIHGATATPFSAWYGRKAEVETFDEEREGTVAGLFGSHEDQIPRVTVDTLNELMNSDTPPIVLDVRSRANYETDGGQIPGGVRVLPHEVTDWASDHSHDRLVVAYCT
jgi:NhaP-type Na+/H+ or K+/H+ antiporter